MKVNAEPTSGVVKMEGAPFCIYAKEKKELVTISQR